MDRREHIQLGLAARPYEPQFLGLVADINTFVPDLGHTALTTHSRLHRGETMNRRTVLFAGGAVLCLAAVIAVAFVSFGTQPQANADTLKPGPVPVTSPLPPDGLVLEDGAMVFKPLPATMNPGPNGEMVLTEEQAVRVGRSLDIRGLPVTAVLASVTMPGDFWDDPSVPGISNPIKDHPVWVLTFSLPAPVDVSLGSRPGADAPPQLVSHHTLILDAYTGDFIRGFLSR
jgi:hypothetical protein